MSKYHTSGVLIAWSRAMVYLRKSTVVLLLVTIPSLGLAACVVSDRPLLADAKPLFGESFDMVLYKDFDPSKGYGSQEVSYRWTDGVYLRDSASTSNYIRFVAEPLAADDFLIQRSQVAHSRGTSNIFTYWISRKVTNGTYLIFPVNEHDLTSTERSAICGEDTLEGFCSIKNHEQLLIAAHATARQPVRDPAVGILVDSGVRNGAAIHLVKDKP